MAAVVLGNEHANHKAESNGQEQTYDLLTSNTSTIHH